MKLLATYKLSNESIDILTTKGFDVNSITISQNQLSDYINKNSFEALIIDSNIKINNEILDHCESLKLIFCVLNNPINLDENYAELKNVKVIKIQNAFSVAQAELVFAHLFSMARFLHQTNREMPLEGDMRFNELSNHFSKGRELKSKTLGVIGFNNTEKEIIKIAIGLGMNIIVSSETIKESNIDLDFFDGQSVTFTIKAKPLDYLLKNSDFISIHELINNQQQMNSNEFDKMKFGVGVINVCKAGLLNEVDLLKAIENEKVIYAALDAFEKQPKPEIQILMNPEISLSPNISRKTNEIKTKIENELLEKIDIYIDVAK